jgi:hypothetical protein
VTAGGFQVTTGALRTEAVRWSAAGARMTALTARLEALRFAGDYGLLERHFAPSYQALIETLVARCSEADDRMSEIGQTLGQLANEYEAAEEAHARAIREAAAAPASFRNGEVFRSAEAGGS